MISWCASPYMHETALTKEIQWKRACLIRVVPKNSKFCDFRKQFSSYDSRTASWALTKRRLIFAFLDFQCFSPELYSNCTAERRNLLHATGPRRNLREQLSSTSNGYLLVWSIFQLRREMFEFFKLCDPSSRLVRMHMNCVDDFRVFGRSGQWSRLAVTGSDHK